MWFDSATDSQEPKQYFLRYLSIFSILKITPSTYIEVATLCGRGENDELIRSDSEVVIRNNLHSYNES